MIAIYIIKCKTNNKCYIGQSDNIKRRWNDHIYKLNKNKAENPYLQAAWNKYGKDEFVFSILKECTKEELNSLEVEYIKEFNTLDKSCGYNMIAGGNVGPSRKGVKYSDEIKTKMSISSMKYTEEQYIKIHELYLTGNYTQKQIKLELNMSNNSNIHKVLNFKIGCHMKEHPQIKELYKNITEEYIQNIKSKNRINHFVSDKIIQRRL